MKQKLPEGWTEERVKKVVDYYESQSDDEAIAEDEAALEMTGNKNTEYELLVREIYQAINSSEAVKTIDVKHNVRVEGRSGCKHQIDVFWEFVMMGEIHRVVVECKNYSDLVSIAKVRDFFGVLYDIGSARGIFVSKMGFQSGTKAFANYYGISLKEIRKPLNEDWKGKVRDIRLDFKMNPISVKHRNFDFDHNWIIENTDIELDTPFEIAGMSDEIKIVSSEGTELTNLHKLENELPRGWVEEVDKTHTYTFENAFISFPQGQKFKVNGVTFEYDVFILSTSSAILGDEVVKAIIKDVKTGKLRTVFHDGNIKDS